jgi:hypothetical protein
MGSPCNRQWTPHPMFPTNRMRPRAGRFPEAKAYSGFSRSRLYQLAPAYPGLFRKNGTAVIVDFDILDRIIDELPVAEIKPPKRHGLATETITPA